MKWIVIGMIVLGLIAASASAVLLASVRAGLLSKAEAPGPTQEPTQVEILVAAQDLPAMTMIGSDAIERRQVDPSSVPAGAATDAIQLVGRVLITPMMAGQAFLTRQLASGDSEMSLVATLPPGGRAVNISVPSDTGVIGLLYPGSLVDVVVSFRVPASVGVVSGEIVSVTILQRVRVLRARGRSIVSNEDAEADDPTSSNIVTGQRRYVVTLLVDQKQAEALQLAVTHGQVSLAVRNPLDDERVESTGVMLSDLSEELSRRIGALAADDLSAQAVQVPLQDPPPAETTATEAALEETPEALIVAEAPKWSARIYRGPAVEVVEFDVDVDDDDDDDAERLAEARSNEGGD